MRALALAVWLVGCGAPPAASGGRPRPVDVPAARPAPAPAAGTPAPTAITRAIVVGPKTALVPDSACLERPREEHRLLGFRPLPDTETLATFLLVADTSVCTAKTHARAELFLARSESLEQNASCGAWRVELCASPPLWLAIPSPPVRSVRAFAWEPSWQDMDAQSDGLGEPRREVHVSRVPGTALSLLQTRKGITVLESGQKRVDAFRARAFVLVDDVPYAVTATSLVRLADPPEYRDLPALFTSPEPPAVEPHPWERQN